MVDQLWIEDKISKMEADRLEDNWTDIREKQLQFLLNIYRTGKFSKYSYNQINSELEIIHTRYVK